jgi:hypothetical protein
MKGPSANENPSPAPYAQSIDTYRLGSVCHRFGDCCSCHYRKGITMPEKMKPWRQMPSGRVWPLLNPTPQDVYWPDLAEALSKTNRWGGSTTVLYSVAQHCCIVHDMLPVQYRLAGLLHDAEEAALGFDMPRPVKDMFDLLGAGEVIKRAASIQKTAIFAAAGLPYPFPDDMQKAVKDADMCALATERRDVNRPCNVAWASTLPPPLPDRIRPWPWPKAMEEFLKRLNRALPGKAGKLF